MAITPVQQICPSSKWNIKCPYAMTPEFIVCHNTANDASALNEVTYMNNNNNQVSFHFAVDDKEVRQGIPLDRNAWHAGDGGNGNGNRKGIAIEICYSLSGGARFDNAEKLAAKFIAQLLKERNWDLSRVRTHNSFSGKYCPHRTLDYGWDRFKGMVQSELNQLSKPAIEWKNDEKATYIAIADTALYDITAGQAIKHYPAGSQFEFVQHAIYNGRAYYRTIYSRDNNVNNGLPMADFVPVDEVEKKKVVWEDIDPIKLVAVGNCQFIDVATLEVVEEVPLGEVIEFVQKTTHGGVVYYRTLEDKLGKHDYGIPADKLMEYKEPELNEDESEDPLPAIPDPKPTDYPTEMPGWFISFINAVVDFIKKLIGKGE